MKIETKRKILWWAKRVLRYTEYSDNRSHIVVETKKIVKVRSEHQYPNYEIIRISEHQIQFAASLQLMDELVKNKMIKYTRHPDKEFTRVVAELKVIVP